MTTEQIINIILGAVSAIATFIGYYYFIKGVVAKATDQAVNDAEQDGRIGEEKFALAVDQVYCLVPAIIKPFLSEKTVGKLVQAAFNQMEKYALKQVAKTNPAEKDSEG